MQCGKFRQCITWLLIASPLWWMCGCYSEVTHLSEAVGTKIKVVTKGDKVYTFERWSSDGFGGISGNAEWLVASSKNSPSHYANGHLTLPIDSIRSVSTKDSNTGLYVVAATTISVGLFAGLVYLILSTDRLFPGGIFAGMR
jgi:hypothetical protein